MRAFAKFMMFAAVCMSFLSSSLHAGTWYTVVRCEGLRMEISDRTFPTKQIVINDVNQSFANFGRMLPQWGNSPYFVKKWDAQELVIYRYPVRWNAEFVTYSPGRLLTVDFYNEHAIVRVYEASLLNEDEGVVNPSTLKFLGDQAFNGCRRL